MSVWTLKLTWIILIECEQSLYSWCWICFIFNGPLDNTSAKRINTVAVARGIWACWKWSIDTLTLSFSAYLPFIGQNEHCSHTTAINLSRREKASLSSSSAKWVPSKFSPCFSSLLYYSLSHFIPPSLPVTVPVLIKGSRRTCIVSIVNEWLVVLCVRGDALAACSEFVFAEIFVSRCLTKVWAVLHWCRSKVKQFDLILL